MCFMLHRVITPKLRGKRILITLKESLVEKALIILMTTLLEDTQPSPFIRLLSDITSVGGL